MQKQPVAIVVGAGVGGLAVAIRLAVKGYKVQVFEKNAVAGGKIAAFNLKGYQFDEGPSLFTQPGNIEELFSLAGKPIQSYFRYQSLPVACRYFYSDGAVVNAYTNQHAFAGELSKVLGEDDNAVLRYLGQSEKLYNNVGSIFLNHSLHTSGILQAPLGKALATAKPGFVLNSLHQLNQKAFSNPHTVQLFDRYATYNGSNPYQAPAMLSMIPHLEQNLGTYYPAGGMISIAEALYRLAEDMNVTFHFNKPVDNIEVRKGTVTGVVADGTTYAADVVVSNMDVYFTYKTLLNDDVSARRVLRQERSSSAVIFYWGIKQSFKELLLHNIFFSADYKQEFSSIFQKGEISSDPTVYINITSKMEKEHAPFGGENWFVMVNAPANKGQNWNTLVQQCRQSVISKLNAMLNTDIESLVEVEQIMSPVGIEQKTSSYMGSLYGTSSNGKMAAFLRHPNFSRKIRGLYFAGGSVHPGGGIPLCLHSAKIVANLVSKHRGK